MDDGDNHDWRYCGTGSHLGKLRDAAPPPEAKPNLVRVIKSERRLTSYRDGRLIKSYAIALGRSPIGQKEGEGDGRTPKGMYNIDSWKPDSAFNRALHIPYPNLCDIGETKQ